MNKADFQLEQGERQMAIAGGIAPSSCAGDSPSRSKELFGSPLVEVADVDRLREIAAALWELLDDIDTASDMFKPSDEVGYRRFYKYAMKKSEARYEQVTSDGYDLYLPNAGSHRQEEG